MGELSVIKPPQMEWNDSDLPTAFKSFKQYCQLIFDGPLNTKEDKFATYLEPKSNFRTARYQLQGFRQADDESVDSFMARCKIQAQKCRFSEAEHEERLIKQLIIGTRERKVQEVLLGKDDKFKLDKAMDIARTKEATVNDMRSLEQQGASARPHDTNIDAVKQNSNPKCGKCGLSHGKKCPAQGTRCRKCNQWNTGNSSNVNLLRDEAFAKIPVELPNVDHPNPELKVKVDTGAQGNILPLRIYKNLFPDNVDENGLPTGTTHRHYDKFSISQM
ncbi:uncharacterized protein [Montipora capricornis]|uniref:uncharacterized protein n=1 Tax=Montipora capricornis TaxID=246305 RepID=UPI0035F1577B